MAHDLNDPLGLRHKSEILEQRDYPRDPAHDVLFAQSANALSGIRFALAFIWIGAFAAGSDSRAIFATLAIAATLSDILDGRLARRLGTASATGRWLDSLADITFILVALTCEAIASAIPFYIPLLIATSFTQYAFDSVLVHREGVPVRSRLGHWGGVINYALVIALSISLPHSYASTLIRESAPVLALFYLAAIIERALGYRAG